MTTKRDKKDESNSDKRGKSGKKAMRDLEALNEADAVKGGTKTMNEMRGIGSGSRSGL